MLKEELERRLSKGTRSQEGVKPSAIRYRFNEITHSIYDSGALRLKPRVAVSVERLSPECIDKTRTLLQTEKANLTEINPFADIPFGIRKICLTDGPLHIEVTGDKFDKVPWVLTVIILEAVCGWSYQGFEKIIYIPTKKGPKRLKDVGLFYEGEKPIAVMYHPRSSNDCKMLLVKWLVGKKQILVMYKPAGRSDGRSRLGYRFFIDYVMFSSSWAKQKAIEILTPLERRFNEKYEPTLAQTKKKFSTIGRSGSSLALSD